MVITLFVLLIDASLHSRSTGQVQQISAGKWIDAVLPVITASDSEGQELAAVWTNGLKTQPSALVSEVDLIASDAATDYAAVAKLSPPADLAGPAGLLEAALYARSKAAGELAACFSQDLGSAAGARSATAAANPATIAVQVNAAGSELQVGDQTYQLFLSSLPSSLGVKPQASAWAADQSPYATAAAQVFLTTLQNAVVTTPVNQVKVVSVTTNPSPVSTSGSIEVLPDATALTLDVTVADTGNQPASNLTVTAALSPAGRGSASVRDFVDLGVGQAYTITGLGPLDPTEGVTETLTVAVSPSIGAAPLVTQTLTLEMPAPPSTTTSTG